ncbi:Protein red1 [Pseudocercospora fuligena]|uniref:Protein red1 n=1 Tax=Pseudocercospora fuligena TaxID=685502 RepID=A0A8H6VRI5_9PEZI|nr:Protein red1 [Pseudocercospora fuligena]
MSQNIPFLFGQPPAPVQTQHQQNGTNIPPQTPTNGAPTPTTQQQMAAPPAGLPAGFDMSALAGVTPEQFAMIARMIQQGVVPMPPGVVPPPAAATPPSAPATTWSTNPPQPSADTPTPPNTSSATQANGQDVDMDKEEGELEEGEMEDAPKARDFLRTPPKGPRKRSRSPLPRGNAAPADRRGSQQGPALARPELQRAASSTGPAQASRSDGKAPVVNQPLNGNAHQPAVGKDAAAKAFILEMHRNGYSFDQLSREVGDTKTLRRMYQQLGLPLPSSSASPANQGGVPITQQPRKTSMPIATKVPTPQNRSEYLAKLQAAKNKKAEASAKSATPPAAPTAASTTETTTVDPRLQPAKPAAAPAAAPRTGGLTKDKNELLRQKLDKLKAEQAARQQAKQSSDAAAPSSPAVKPDQNATPPMPASRPGLGAGLVEAAARASDEASSNVGSNGFVASQNMAFQAPVPSASPTLNRGFGLPGLFTTMLASARSNDASPQPISSRPTSSAPAQNVFAAPSSSTQQPVSAIEAPRNGSTTQSQNFGQSRDVCHDDRYVIEVSSDEEEEDESMDVDDIPEKPHAEQMHFSNSTLKTTRPKLQMPTGGISTPGTPGVGTPNADLKRKLEEIEEYKRQIAEAERKRQRNGKVKAQAAQEEALVDAVDQVIASSNALASGNATPNETQPPLETAYEPGNLLSTGANPERPSSASSATARIAREQEKETLRRRLAELEVQRNQLSSAPAGNATAQPQLAFPGMAMNNAAPAPAHSNTIAAPSAIPVNDANDSDEIDDEDDEDLYADYATDQATQSAPQPHHTQATRDDLESSSEEDQFEGEGDDVFEPDPVNDVETQESVSALPTAQDTPTIDVSSTIDPSIPAVETMAAPLDGDDHEIEDDDDLDNLYDEAASAPTVEPTEPAVQTLTDAMASNDDAEEDDSDDAMDTSDASSDSDSSSDESDHEPESRPDHPQHSETVQNPAATLSSGEDVDENRDDEESDEDSEDTNDDVQDMGDTELSVNDDLAPELQPPMEELDVPTETIKPKTHYTPYESPLHRFKDFRFHPEFEHTVPGGFKSLTYSHKIDPENTLCPFELNGGSCIDKSCTHQHFRSLALSGTYLCTIWTKNGALLAHIRSFIPSLPPPTWFMIPPLTDIANLQIMNYFA